jgi:hypothetical protein
MSVGNAIDWKPVAVFSDTHIRARRAGRTAGQLVTLWLRDQVIATLVFMWFFFLYFEIVLGNQSVVYGDIKRNRIYVLCTCVCVCFLDLCEMGNKFHVVRFKQHGREDSRSDFHGLTNRIVLGEEKRVIEFLKNERQHIHMCLSKSKRKKNGTRIFVLLTVIDGVYVTDLSVA